MALIDRLVPIYLMSSYLYHEEDTAVLEDCTHDAVCQILYNYFDEIKHHHKKYLSKDDLRAGTGMGFHWKGMPQIIAHTSLWWIGKFGEYNPSVNADIQRVIDKCNVAYGDD